MHNRERQMECWLFRVGWDVIAFWMMLLMPISNQGRDDVQSITSHLLHFFSEKMMKNLPNVM
jgi:hypothetical protein